MQPKVLPLNLFDKAFHHEIICIEKTSEFSLYSHTGKNSGFPLLDILGYLKNTHKNPKFGRVRRVPTREFPTKFPDWDLFHSSKFGIFVGNTLKYPKMVICYFFLCQLVHCIQCKFRTVLKSTEIWCMKSS